MIHIEERNDVVSKVPLTELFTDGDGASLNERISKTIERLKQSSINGCITGSCMLEGFDPDLWGCTPDIDVFVYSEVDLVSAIDYCMDVLGMEPGKGGKRSKDQEEFKLGMLKEEGVNKKFHITTYTFNYCGVLVNVTYKETKKRGRWVACDSAPAVLQTFDMSIVLQAYDIPCNVLFDLRPDNVPKTTAVPNPLRKVNTMTWTVRKWVRQFDRVVKYYNRGFDTRPMAQFYLDMIDRCLKSGCLFDSEESQLMYAEATKEFAAKRADIADWLDAHKED